MTITFIGAWQFGTTDNDYGNDITTDSQGNVYIVGTTEGALTGSNLGGTDAFLSKYDDNGNVLWQTQIGTSDNDFGEGVIVDNQQNIYVTGYTENGTENQAFLAKYHSDGSQQWKIDIPNTNEGFAVATDNEGNIYLTGQVKQGNIYTGREAFLTKYDANGNQIWIRETDGQWATGFAIDIDLNGNIYIVGKNADNYVGPIQSDAFIAKYDDDGNLLWKNDWTLPSDFFTNYSEVAYGVSTDSQGNSYITGKADGNLFVVQYDSEGNEGWERDVSLSSMGNDLVIDNQDYLYIIGNWTNQSNSNQSPLLLQFNNYGEAFIASPFNYSGNQSANAITIDKFNNLYYIAETDTALVSNYQQKGGTDILVIKYQLSDSSDVNQAPIAIDDFVSTNENESVAIAPLNNDTDADGDTLTITEVSNGNNGTVVNNNDGTVTYTPNANFNGEDSFTYTISDGNGGTDTATITVTVNPINDNPIAVDDELTINEDTAGAIAPLTNDTDIDGDTLTIAEVTNGNSGTVINNNDGTVTYTPNANFSGEDSFTYTISDGNGGTDTATVNVTVNPLNDVNDALIEVMLTDGEIANGVDDIVFGTPLSQFRTGATDSLFVRPSYGDRTQYIDITNSGTGGVLQVTGIEINAPDVSIDYDFGTQGDILLNQSETQRIGIHYTPSSVGQDFNLADGLVIFSNAVNDSTTEVALRGKSTYDADISYDGVVSFGDLGPLTANWGRNSSSNPWDPTADINGDGFVSFGDLGPLTAEWGQSMMVA